MAVQGVHEFLVRREMATSYPVISKPARTLRYHPSEMRLRLQVRLRGTLGGSGARPGTTTVGDDHGPQPLLLRAATCTRCSRPFKRPVHDDTICEPFS
jgi:hypothetical protein